ncbi:hypothetical protein BDV28DRAFT_2980 [Aspergillus coremiiformis]|uniref:Uncharacterized protein n=1 Tax=Aspergillus coremiiformis TaxID=138285 RepID=A0A5N6ZG13_9EURO|nr:hypothetical protein BDV28DRAFT_2980 [Aspergillus coremiiformis]
MTFAHNLFQCYLYSVLSYAMLCYAITKYQHRCATSMVRSFLSDLPLLGANIPDHPQKKKDTSWAGFSTCHHIHLVTARHTFSTLFPSATLSG